MEMLIKVLHISLAVWSLVLAGGVVWQTKKDNFEAATLWVKKMWYGTTVTITSGIILTFVARVSIGRFCVSSFALLAVILLAHYYKVHSQKLDTTSHN